MPTFWIPANATTDASYGLPPFWKNENEFWTSNDAYRTDALGYAYPETQYWNFPSDEEWRNNVKGLIESLYPNSARTTLVNAIATGNTLKHTVDQNSTFTDWVIQVKASVTKMPSTFKAMFSLVGDFSSDEPTEVGVWMRAAMDGSEPGASSIHQIQRKAQRPSTVDDGLSRAIGITSPLLEAITAGKLENLDPEVVIPYLQTHLTWNVYAVRLLYRTVMIRHLP